jgi:hypothetical protein
MMEPTNVQGKKFPVIGGGTCIYCGSDGGSKGLTDEHAVPYSLGGNAELLEASCADCGKITSYLDGYLANATYKHFRVHAGVQTRSGHPGLLPAKFELADGERVIDLATPDHPFFLHMPVWKRPGILRGAQPSADFGDAKAHVYWYIPPNIGQTLDLKRGELARLEDTTPMPNIVTFARAIAKIAYCNAIIRFGLNGFRSLALTDLILGKYPNIPHFVGSKLGDPPPPHARGVRHAADFGSDAIGRMRLLTVYVRLFAHAGTENEGMPIYQVVVGAEGRPITTSRRPLPVLPRTIQL